MGEPGLHREEPLQEESDHEGQGAHAEEARAPATGPRCAAVRGAITPAVTPIAACTNAAPKAEGRSAARSARDGRDGASLLIALAGSRCDLVQEEAVLHVERAIEAEAPCGYAPPRQAALAGQRSCARGPRGALFTTNATVIVAPRRRPTTQAPQRRFIAAALPARSARTGPGRRRAGRAIEPHRAQIVLPHRVGLVVLQVWLALRVITKRRRERPGRVVDEHPLARRGSASAGAWGRAHGARGRRARRSADSHRTTSCSSPRRRWRESGTSARERQRVRIIHDQNPGPNAEAPRRFGAP